MAVGEVVFRAVAARVVHWAWNDKPFVVQVKMDEDRTFDNRGWYATREEASTAAQAWLTGAIVLEEVVAESPTMKGVAKVLTERLDKAGRSIDAPSGPSLP